VVVGPAAELDLWEVPLAYVLVEHGTAAGGAGLVEGVGGETQKHFVGEGVVLRMQGSEGGSNGKGVGRVGDTPECAADRIESILGTRALPRRHRHDRTRCRTGAAVARAPVSEDPDFQQWVTEEGGPDAVLAMVDEVRRQADDGSLRGFTDKDEFLAYPGRRGRRSA
jgi:hypothetical protein